MKIVIPDSIHISDDAQMKLKTLYSDFTFYQDTVNVPEAIKDRIKDAEIITANFIDLTEEIINSAPKLKYIISPAKGFDWIDVRAATKRGIRVLNCPSYNSRAVAEHAIGLMFAVKRSIFQAQMSIINGEYNTHKFLGTEVNSNLLVTVGYGNVAKHIISMAHGLGMKTEYANSKTSSEDLDKLISISDVLVLCLPLNESTNGIINKNRIALMKKSAILINVARGLVVNQEALYEALKSNKIAGAGIDTFAKDETLSQARQDIIDFAKLSNVVATPHIAYNTIEASVRLGEELLRNIDSCIKGTPINVINK